MSTPLHPQPLDILIAAWSAALAADDRSVHTIRAYLRVIGTFIAWYEHERHEVFAPTSLTAIDLIAYRQQLQRQQRAAASINQQVAALRAFASWLQEAGYRSDNPAARFKMVETQSPHAPKSLQPTEIHALLRAAQQQGERDYAIVQVLLQTGMRLSECAALCLGDLQITERMGQIIIRSGKGNKARNVPANASVRSALASYLAPLWGIDPVVKVVVAAWNDQKPTTPLWRGQRGALTSRSIGRIIEELVVPLARRGLLPEQTSAHTLRHTFATIYLVDNPGDLFGLATLLGHTSLETTRIYTHLSDDDLGRRVEQMRTNAYDG